MFAKVFEVENGTAQVIFMKTFGYDEEPMIKIITQVEGLHIEGIKTYNTKAQRNEDFEQKFNATMAQAFYEATKAEIEINLDANTNNG